MKRVREEASSTHSSHVGTVDTPISAVGVSTHSCPSLAAKREVSEPQPSMKDAGSNERSRSRHSHAVFALVKPVGKRVTGIEYVSLRDQPRLLGVSILKRIK
jgi:hypothetical protein